MAGVRRRSTEEQVTGVDEAQQVVENEATPRNPASGNLLLVSEASPSKTRKITHQSPSLILRASPKRSRKKDISTS